MVTLGSRHETQFQSPPCSLKCLPRTPMRRKGRRRELGLESPEPIQGLWCGRGNHWLEGQVQGVPREPCMLTGSRSQHRCAPHRPLVAGQEGEPLAGNAQVWGDSTSMGVMVLASQLGGVTTTGRAPSESSTSSPSSSPEQEAPSGWQD